METSIHHIHFSLSGGVLEQQAEQLETEPYLVARETLQQWSTAIGIPAWTLSKVEALWAGTILDDSYVLTLMGIPDPGVDALVGLMQKVWQQTAIVVRKSTEFVEVK